MWTGQSSLKLALLFSYLPFLFLEAFIWMLRLAGWVRAGDPPGMLNPDLPPWLEFLSHPLFGLLIMCAGIALLAVSTRAAGDNLVLVGLASGPAPSPTPFPWLSAGGITVLGSLVAVVPLLWNSLARDWGDANTAEPAVSSPPARSVPAPATPPKIVSSSKRVAKETWKPLTATQQAQLASRLSSHRAAVRVVSIPQDDAFELAKGLHAAFRQAGWTMENSKVNFFLVQSGTVQQGKICVAVMDPRKAAVARIRSALREVLHVEPCTRVNRLQAEAEIIVEVWPK